MVDFQALFRHSPNPYMVVGPDLRYLAANEAYAAAVSTSADALIGRYLFEVFPGDAGADGPSQSDRVRHSIERAFATGRPDVLALVSYAIERETPQGRVVEERFWSATHTPLYGADGRVSAVLQHTTDVTDIERDRAELARTRGANTAQLEQGVFDRARAVQDANLALDSQRRQLMALFAQAPGFMAVLRGPEYVFEIANAAYEELIANENIVGRRIADVLPEIVDQGYMELLDQVRLTGRRFVGRGMRVQLARAGELAPRYVDFIYQPIVDETGEVAAIFVQGADVTDREMLVAALRESERALRDADLRKDRFLATLAHELRNPLAPIGTAAALLQVASEQPARVREASGIIDRQVRHLTHLVNDLLDVSRVTSGHATLDLQWMDLADSVHAAAEQVAPLVARKAQALQVQLPDAAVLMRGDPARMTQVLANLLTNAAKYTPAYGHITVAVDVQDGMARIDVADDGIGMSADLLPQVFELFVQAEPTPDREEGGLGIGLALVRSLVQLHGGRVEAHSDGPGLGSRFRMCLPCEVTVPA